jgi:hypothetical protein
MAAGIRRPRASSACFCQTLDVTCSLWCGMSDNPARVRCRCRHDSCPRTSRRVLSVPSGPEPALLDYSRSGVGRGPVERSPARRGIPYDLSSDQTYTSASGLARRHGRGSRSPGPHGINPQEVRGAHEIPSLALAQFFFAGRRPRRSWWHPWAAALRTAVQWSVSLARTARKAGIPTVARAMLVICHLAGDRDAVRAGSRSRL